MLETEDGPITGGHHMAKKVRHVLNLSLSNAATLDTDLVHSLIALHQKEH